MIIRLAAFSLAMMGFAAVAQAQTIPSNPPKGPVHVDQSGYLRDATGAIIDNRANRIIGSDTARPGPGDYGMPPANQAQLPAIESGPSTR